MNRALIQQVIDIVESYPTHFDQGRFGIDGDGRENWIITGNCYSPCCIAGHVMILTGNEKPENWDTKIKLYNKGDAYNEMERIAAKELGITLDQGYALFSSAWPYQWFVETDTPLELNHVARITTDAHNPYRTDVVRVLKRLLDHGFSHSTFDEFYEEKEKANDNA